MSATLDNLRVNAARLWSTIMETARIGGTPKGGICRLTLTDYDCEVRDWFAAACRDAGCTVAVDDLGNMFARRPGRDNSLPPIGIGSHLDTQPTGGKFDGVLGVLAALEVVRTLNDAGIETNAPIEIVNWTNEEGSRFAPAMLCSGVFGGAFTKEYAYSREDRTGKTFGEELERIGYKGAEPCGARKLSAFFELHIEQGPILEDEGKEIGIVTGVQAIRWFEATVTGEESHAGSTPMGSRKDALLAAARMIEAGNAIALKHPPAVLTVGLIESHPNSRNVIPGSVFFTVDLRHPEAAMLDTIEAELSRELPAIAARSKVGLEFTRTWDSAPVRFDAGCIAAVRDSAASLGLSAREIVSGPGHDSVYVSRVAPASMIFVPCERGISHNEAERIEPGQATAGANVLLHAALRADARLAAGT